MVISLRAYLLLLAALAAERLFELLLSARNIKRVRAIGGVELGRSHYLLITSFHALFIISAATEAIMLKRPFPGLLGWAALIGALIAQILRYWCIITLGPRWTTRIIVLPNAAPVTGGPYRFIRHPNYLAVILEIACVPLIHGCWLTAGVFSAINATLLRVRILAEEAALGPGYASMLSKPRLLPALFRCAPHASRQGRRLPQT